MCNNSVHFAIFFHIKQYHTQSGQLTIIKNNLYFHSYEPVHLSTALWSTAYLQAHGVTSREST
jgi:hypothetical protein